MQKKRPDLGRVSAGFFITVTLLNIAISLQNLIEENYTPPVPQPPYSPALYPKIES
jgi:hypothetical protein